MSMPCVPDPAKQTQPPQILDEPTPGGPPRRLGWRWHWQRALHRPDLHRPTLTGLLVQVPLALALLSAVLLATFAGPPLP
ncbi:MAG: hypothetical protein RLZZ584_2816 [Pseudomonadota bacterium]|jgi:hypothetical protein